MSVDEVNASRVELLIDVTLGKPQLAPLLTVKVELLTVVTLGRLNVPSAPETVTLTLSSVVVFSPCSSTPLNSMPYSSA